MIIDKKQWEAQAGRLLRQKKKLLHLMYAHFILTIPLMIWMIRFDSVNYEMTWVGHTLLNGSLLFAVLVMMSHFTLERQRKQLIASHEMMEMLEVPKGQYDKQGTTQ